MADALSKINVKETPQKRQAREDQVKNNAGGYVFEVPEENRVERFLMLGVDGGTYYVNEEDHAYSNAQFIFDVAKSRGTWLVNKLTEISLSGRAPRQNPTLFTLAVVSVMGDLEARQAAYQAVPKVCRTGTMLFQFIAYREQLGGWSAGLRRAVGNAWYNLKPIDRLAYQAIKYRQRDGWTHRDILRLAHPKPSDAMHDGLYAHIVGKEKEDVPLPELVSAFEQMKNADVKTAIDLIAAHPFSWEMLPDSLVTKPKIWEALFEHQRIPHGALIRQLPRLTNMGLLTPLGDFTKRVANRLKDEELLKRARVHPVNLLIATRTYANGRGTKNTWTPTRQIVDALDDAFYKSFQVAEPTGKRFMLALDVSGSMSAPIPGRKPGEYLPINCREAAAAVAMSTARIEENYMIVGFTTGRNQPGQRGMWRGGYSSWRDDTILSELSISPRQRLDDIVHYTSRLDFGGTDCSLPMLHALEKSIPVDCFVVYTDNETWHGSIHPYQALQKYRKATGIDAKLVVVSMTASPFSIADPKDPGMLDIVGFDAAVPSLINNFAKDDDGVTEPQED